jgi:predicted XRE-type DNA-binding protein
MPDYARQPLDISQKLRVALVQSCQIHFSLPMPKYESCQLDFSRDFCADRMSGAVLVREGSREMKPIRQGGSSADECEKLKIDLARAIATTLKRRDLAQVEAAKIIGVDESKVSALIRGRLTGYSVDRLVRYLIALGNDVDVQISGRGGNRAGRIKVVVT